MQVLLKVLLLLALACTARCSDGFFTVVGSSTMNFRGVYRATVVYSNYEREEKLRVGVKIKEKETNESSYGVYKDVTLAGTGIQNLEFDMRDQVEGHYVLSAVGANFSGFEGVHINARQFSFLIQTDKAIYKPSDTVRFRILALDADSRPFALGANHSLDIFVADGRETRVKQFEAAAFNAHGVFRGELRLSDSPVLGVWRLLVRPSGEERELAAKEFAVAEYVPPKFEVAVTANEDANFRDGKLRATVKATYTFGRRAKGTATVTAEVGGRRFGWWRQPAEAPRKVSKSVRVDGKDSVVFDVRDELGMNETSYPHSVRLVAVFVEELSGRAVNATAEVVIKRSRHSIEFRRNYEERLKVGLPFDISVLVRTHDGNAPVTDAKNPLTLNVFLFYDVLRTCKRRTNPPKWSFGDESTTTVEPTTTEAPQYEEYVCAEERNVTRTFELFLKNGEASVRVDVDGNTTAIGADATYLDTKQDHFHVSGRYAMTKSGKYLQLTLLTKKPSINEEIQFKVRSNVDITAITYLVFSRGILHESKMLKFGASKEIEFGIKASSKMIPKASVIVYYLNDDGEIISDRSSFELESQFLNFIDINLAKDTAKPGEGLNISLTTNANSFVGLLGVDQSILLLKTGNDIDKATVDKEREKFARPTDYNHIWYEEHKHHRPERFIDFAHLDTVLITNVRGEFDPPFIPHYYEVQEDSDSDSVPEMAVYHKESPVPQSAVPISADVGPSRKIDIRNFFPETWLFDEFEFDANTTTKTFTRKVPDTITSWVITGFSVDPATGLGLTRAPSTLTVFQPFFAATSLPYALKRGEVVSVPVQVFNYLASDQPTRVTLFNDRREFEFVEVAADANQLRAKRALDAKRTKTVTAQSDGAAVVAFMIRPLKAGSITVKVTAEAPLAGDGFERELLVRPEGVTQHRNEAVFLDLRTASTAEKTIDIEVPADAVDDSVRIEAAATGDLLGPTIENLNQLIRLPYGCGEQTMVNFVPNILVLDYLTQLGRLTPAIEAKCREFMEVGYQRELTFRHKDGSFSSFGDRDKAGSTWLTAYVARSFLQASRFIHVDREPVREALKFLGRVQAANGSFPEVGSAWSSRVDGGEVGLTAYTLLTLLEGRQHGFEANGEVERALDFIVTNVDTDTSDNFTLAISAYALKAAGHAKSDSFINALASRAESSHGMKFWTKREREHAADDLEWSWLRRLRTSDNIEMSAYAMLAFVEDGRDSDAVAVMRWLVSQQNSRGGFQSSQDTVVALQALAKMAVRIYVPASDIEVAVKASGRAPAVISLNARNAQVLQSHRLPSDERRFEVEARGRGFSVLQIAYSFNVADEGEFPRFRLRPALDATSNKNFLALSVCASFVADERAHKSNMALMEVSLPSGFTFDSDSLAGLLAVARVKKVETKESETIVVIYFDDLDASDTCPVVKAYRTHAVAKQRPAPVVIYDYYDDTRHARAFYNAPEVSLCDICEGEDECKGACEVSAAEA